MERPVINPDAQMMDVKVSVKLTKAEMSKLMGKAKEKGYATRKYYGVSRLAREILSNALRSMK